MIPPTNPLAQAHALLDRGDFAGAAAAWQRATRGGKNSFDADILGSRIHLALGNTPQARFLAQRAADSAGPDARRLVSAGGALAQAGLNEEGIAAYRKALRLAPNDDGAAACLVGTIFRTGRYDEALAEAAAAIQRHPTSPQVALNHGSILTYFGRLDEAAAVMRRALDANPEFVPGRSNLCMWTNYLTGDPAELLAVHKAYGTMLERAHTPQIPPYANTKDPDRTLRLGIVSGDLRRGSVMSFFEPLLANLDKSRVEPWIYSLNPAADAVTARLKSHAKAWNEVAELSPVALAQQVFTDRIDILLDLGGHTAYNRLPVFHLRPAPVQATYLAYPCTTGLTSIDHRFVDFHTDPPGVADPFATERLVRLDPSFLCFAPAPDSPPVREQRTPGPFVFGSFNNAFKLHPDTLDAWARILTAVPDSILLLKSQGLDHPAMREACLARLTARGLDRARIEICGYTKTYADHLAMYQRVDLALDSFPYHGTTTTCEALWMGVPVLTLAGRCHAARVGVSILSNVGLQNLITTDVDAYVRLAADLANDPSALAAACGGLRDRMAASPLTDAASFALRFEAALRACWRAWCKKR
jgi:predicted O-linked N-acetylglucosamine transferase (SPINDLY family)